MNEEEKYNLTNEILERADIKGEPQDMIEWLDALSEDDREDWFLIATRNKGTNSGVELTEAMMKALVLMSFELDTMELAISVDQCRKITDTFLTNIVLYKGYKEGLYVIKNKLSLILPVEIELTELGKEVAKKLTSE